MVGMMCTIGGFFAGFFFGRHGFPQWHSTPVNFNTKNSTKSLKQTSVSFNPKFSIELPKIKYTREFS